ncbi:MAG: hypothetical protein PSY14_04035 [bacterium]|nr:hypothetical protein [bacterium]
MIAPSRISLQLVFPPDIAHRIVQASQTLATIIASTFTLGTDAPPHITLFSYIGVTTEIAERQTTVVFTDLLKLGDTDGRIWAGLGIAKTPIIVALREELIATCGHPSLLRDEFHPHVTLGNIGVDEWEKSLPAIRHMLTGMTEAQCFTRVFSVPA